MEQNSYCYINQGGGGTILAQIHDLLNLSRFLKVELEWRENQCKINWSKRIRPEDC